MIKSNTFVFLVCLAFLFVLFCFVYQAFQKQLTLLTPEPTKTIDQYDTLDNGISSDQNVTTSMSEQNKIENWAPCHSFGKMRWLHDTETGECYEVGTVGPCGVSMTFYQHPDKHRPNSGFCDCDDIVEVKSLIPGCEGVERPLIYHREDDRCYTVFSQGPCEDNEWLVLDEFYTPVCEQNPCQRVTSSTNKEKNLHEEDEFSLQFWTSHNGKCYKTLTGAYCEKGSVLRVTKNSWKPDCQRELPGMCPLTFSVSISVLECRAGSKLHQLGGCFL